MYLNRKALKEYFKGHEKQISKEALQAFEDSFPMLLAKILGNTGHFKRIQETEVFLAFGQVKEITK